MNGQSIDQAISIFDQHAQQIMVMPVVVNGAMSQMDLLKELMFDERDLADYGSLFTRMKKLPSLLTFYGIMKGRAVAAAEHIDDQYKVWLSGVSDKAKAELIKEQKDFKASMMKAPTIGDIEGRVVLNNITQWEEWRQKKAAAHDRVVMLSSLVEGLQASVRLVGTESSLLQALINRGIEVISQPGSRYSGASRQHITKP
jgi:hypothetical protein